MQDLREYQLKYEEEHDAEAAAERLAQLRQDAREGKLELPHTQRFMLRAVSAVSAAFAAMQAEQTRGPGAKYKGWLRSLPADVLAVLAIQESIRICTSPKLNATTALDLMEPLGRLIFVERRIREAEEVNPIYMQKIHAQIEERNTTNQKHIRGVYSKAYRTVMHEELDSLPRTDYVHIGKFAVQALMQADIIVSEHKTGTKGALVMFDLHPDVLDYIHNYGSDDVRFVVSNSHLLMHCPPDEWTDLFDGGFLSERRKATRQMVSAQVWNKPARRYLRRECTATAAPNVYRVVNYLQAQPWQLHQPTLQAILRVWESGGKVMGVPPRSMPPVPPCPLDKGWIKAEATPEQLEQFAEWKLRAAVHYDALRGWRSKVREITSFIRATAEHTGNVWCPVYADWRGRMYYATTPNPQGSDMAKAVMHFGNKKPLGVEGVFWLKVHIANSLGFDKARFKARAAYTDSVWPALERALDTPEDYPDVWGEDAPWCVYSAAWELREALRSGRPELYQTGVPVHMDATCSGLQHFSAMLRDPEGGRYVNLFDAGGDAKEDIYARVAARALELVRQDTQDPENGAAARWWLARGIDRKLAKRPVMTYVYGVTVKTLTAYCAASIQDADLPDGLRLFKLSAYVAQKLIRAIELTVPAAAAAMRWLKQVARDNPRTKPILWRSPGGMPVIQAYPGATQRRIDVRACGVQKVLMREITDTMNPMEMQNGISPNFVHSLDASHLMLTAMGMQDAGLSLGAIHDSFGTHPCDVSKLHEILRLKFVEVYQNDVLFDFLWACGGVGEVPQRGDLDLCKCLNSEFFFC